MSVQAMAWALTQQVVKESTARHVLLCLANYADVAGRSAFPSVATLCSDTGLSERTIRYKLQALQELGVLIPGNAAVVAAYISRGDKRPECFDIILTPRGANDDTGCISRQNGVQMTTERGAPAAPNPSINHQGTEKKQATLRDLSWQLPDWIDSSAWAGFEEMRKKRRKPMTDRGRDIAVNKLKKLRDQGQDIAAVIDQSVERSWDTFYPVKSEQQRNQYGRPAHDGKTDEYGVLL